MDTRTQEIIEALVCDKRNMKTKIKQLESRIRSLEKLMTFRKGKFPILKTERSSK